MNGQVTSCGLDGLPCGVCCSPAQAMEFYPNGRVATVHVAVRRDDRQLVVTRCWATPEPVPPAKKAEGKKPPRPPVSIAAELARLASSPNLRWSA